jgi:hypothetical protein
MITIRILDVLPPHAASTFVPAAAGAICGAEVRGTPVGVIRVAEAFTLSRDFPRRLGAGSCAPQDCAWFSRCGDFSTAGTSSA